MSEDKKYKLGEENYSTDMNGWTDFTDVPEAKRPITYHNPILDKEQTQNYTENTDILVVPLVRKNKKGEFEFGLVEKEVPATIATEGGKISKTNYSGVMLESVTIALPTKEVMSNEEITSLMDCQMLKLGMYLEGYIPLDDSKTPISQSFTNQCGQFYVAAVLDTKQEDKDIHWFPLGMISSFIENQKDGDKAETHSSLQTMYSLLLLKRKYQKEIDKLPEIPFELDKPTGRLELVSEREIGEHKYRFGINDITYKDRTGEIKHSTYSTSKDSIQCGLISENVQGKRTVSLSPQLRSPLIANEDFNGMLDEVTAGMIEPSQSHLDAAVAEAEQEQGVKLSEDAVQHLYGPILISTSTSELTDLFVADTRAGEATTQKLDEQEVIGEKSEYDIEKCASKMGELKSPLPTKFLIAYLQECLEREKIQKKDNRGDEER